MKGVSVVWMYHTCKKSCSWVQSAYVQCDQIKFTKCLKKLPKNDFTRKMNDFDTFAKIA